MAEAQSINKITIKEFWETGLLQEVNRQFFHPRGLALEIIIPDDPNDINEYKLGGIWDYRDDDEGMLFGGKAPRAEKAVYAKQLIDEKSLVRLERYGWVIQPLKEDD
jgi:hypothetical protein